MKVMIEVKSKERITSPRSGDVILYDADKKEWKIINEKELFARFEQRVKDIEEEWKQFKLDYATQNKKVLNAINKAILNK